MKGVFIMSITSMYRGQSRKGQWVKLPNVIEVEGITLLCGSSGFIVKQSDDGLTAVRGNFTAVLSSSVGAKTSRKDKDNKEIFEGDILRVSTTVEETTTNVDYLVKFKDGAFIAEAVTDGAEDSALSAEFTATAAIIGNSTDDPELLPEDDDS